MWGVEEFEGIVWMVGVSMEYKPFGEENNMQYIDYIWWRYTVFEDPSSCGQGVQENCAYS